jgi:hypothetical protein
MILLATKILEKQAATIFSADFPGNYASRDHSINYSVTLRKEKLAAVFN